MFTVYYHPDSALVSEPAELVGTFKTEKEARRALRRAVGVSRCDDSLAPACATGEVITGADGALPGEEGPFGWIERT